MVLLKKQNRNIMLSMDLIFDNDLLFIVGYFCVAAKMSIMKFLTGNYAGIVQNYGGNFIKLR